MCIASLFERCILLTNLLGALSKVQASQQGGVAGRGERALGEGCRRAGGVICQLLFGVCTLRPEVSVTLLPKEDLVALCVRKVGAAADVELVFCVVKDAAAVGAFLVAADVQGGGHWRGGSRCVVHCVVPVSCCPTIIRILLS